MNRGLLMFLECLLLVSLVFAMSSGNYSIDVVSTGGGESMGSSNYSTSAVVLSVSGSSSSSNYTNEVGTFYGASDIVEQNIAPNVSDVKLVFVDSSNTTISDLNCSALVFDSDFSGGLNVSFRWFLNGSYQLTTFSNDSYNNNSVVSSVLDYFNTTKHDNWSCSVGVFDSSSFSGWSEFSNNLTVLNSLPSVTLTSPSNNSDTTDRTPEFVWNYYDADLDSLTYEINITPYFDDSSSVLDVISESGFSGNSFVPDHDLKLLYDNGYHYRWMVRASDDEGTGDWSDVFRVNISAEIGILLLGNEIYFGDLSIGESNSTENDNPSPFVLENNGTVVVNVSVNASSIWDSVDFDSDKYQFKVDEVASEVGAFNLSRSIIDWFNMPLTGFVVGVDELNYSDATDSVEVDINLTVPEDENPGQKSSTVVFLAELAE